MKGVKTMAVANSSSKRFQSDDIVALKIHLPDGLEVHKTLKHLLDENKKLTTALKQCTDKLKELDDKYNALEVE